MQMRMFLTVKMSARLRKYSPILKALPACPSDITHALCVCASTNFVKAIAEIAYNVLYELDLPQSDISALKPLRRILVNLASKKITISRKKKILYRRGEEVLKAIIPPVMPFISNADVADV